MEAVQILKSDGIDVAKRIVDNVASVLRGKQAAVELAVAALLSGGHLLVEDVPGVGKTTLARALARSVGVSFHRLQFTSDLMPADVVGGSVFDQRTSTFEFHPGPIFTHVLLADEINRTTPRTQSALLEAMGEAQVSVEGKTIPLETPFFVVATQNPDDFHGTYPLPESQLDRFLLRIRIGYPEAAVEREIIRERRSGDPLLELPSVVLREELLAAQAAVDSVRMEDVLIEYLHGIVLRTRDTPTLALGASTRAAIALDRAARAKAIVSGRSFVTPDDIKSLAVPVLAHRVRVSASLVQTTTREDAERCIREIVDSIPIPL